MGQQNSAEFNSTHNNGLFSSGHQVHNRRHGLNIDRGLKPEKPNLLILASRKENESDHGLDGEYHDEYNDYTSGITDDEIPNQQISSPRNNHTSSSTKHYSVQLNNQPSLVFHDNDTYCDDTGVDSSSEQQQQPSVDQTSPRGSIPSRRRRSSSVDSGSMKLFATNQVKQPIAGMDSIEIVEEVMNEKDVAQWTKNRDIAELWHSIPSGYHAGIHRVYGKLKMRFKNDIDISDFQIRQLSCDLGFPNYLYEYMFNKLESSVFSLLHDEYVLKKKKQAENNKKKRREAMSRNGPPTLPSTLTDDVPTKLKTSHVHNFPPLFNMGGARSIHSPLDHANLLNRLFEGDVETIKTQPIQRNIPSFDEFINVNQDMQFEKGLKVKLIITEVGKNPGRIRTAASPIISRLKVFDQFGWFHTSFSVGSLRL